MQAYHQSSADLNAARRRTKLGGCSVPLSRTAQRPTVLQSYGFGETSPLPVSRQTDAHVYREFTRRNRALDIKNDGYRPAQGKTERPRFDAREE